jgi:hypothetical protein
MKAQAGKTALPAQGSIGTQGVGPEEKYRKRHWHH